MGRIGVNIRANNEQQVEATTDAVLIELKKAIKTKDIVTAKKLLYWLNTWSADYLLNEQSFNYQSLIAYKRGMVVKADFGFNVGSEQGGLHYALVIEKNNAKSNRTVTVIPLGSLPDNKTENDIDKKYEVFLGYSLFSEEISNIQEKIRKKETKKKLFQENGQPIVSIEKELKSLNKKIIDYKKGTVAILSQICSLSKIRIHAPKNSGDELFTFRLDSKNLKKIDNKLAEIYIDQENLEKHLTKVED
ncbi:type II toxin-antitoxin system PemK/MazF family toxin [Cytobacillus horneckiae]|uniref:Type II toxin-antitoxin system PemK/MazF family toxin n=1 Tax=Cytobacillus horneckiae TaxID=549687 RepID=A0A2N0ZFB0_9BACI|nr:type II toxin-antitoxin system PemK/MazF family toxin [Cytobacillus horneckiae]MEC1155644.1 type II toxin-antitoxin system PemK/MazF family toxin [Cytobacillus horneckiae]MED2936962.1 type II toxin-antitoxin system PemK/MazF family toxin [Cytobacillus horneckiae]PKG28195.1 hypothetical protein CWS20_15240 [Cytobacillus horneckiae]